MRRGGAPPVGTSHRRASTSPDSGGSPPCGRLPPPRSRGRRPSRHPPRHDRVAHRPAHAPYSVCPLLCVFGGRPTGAGGSGLATALCRRPPVWGEARRTPPYTPTHSRPGARLPGPQGGPHRRARLQGAVWAGRHPRRLSLASATRPRESSRRSGRWGRRPPPCPPPRRVCAPAGTRIVHDSQARGRWPGGQRRGRRSAPPIHGGRWRVGSRRVGGRLPAPGLCMLFFFERPRAVDLREHEVVNAHLVGALLDRAVRRPTPHRPSATGSGRGRRAPAMARSLSAAVDTGSCRQALANSPDVPGIIPAAVQRRGLVASSAGGGRRSLNWRRH